MIVANNFTVFSPLRQVNFNLAAFFVIPVHRYSHPSSRKAFIRASACFDSAESPLHQKGQRRKKRRPLGDALRSGVSFASWFLSFLLFSLIAVLLLCIPLHAPQEQFPVVELQQLKTRLVVEGHDLLLRADPYPPIPLSGSLFHKTLYQSL